ncbi:MAG: hypothetical protein MH252_18800 [Thermosynechococcaceae cyanobacterium MS004]|nr:hypothetical protein [Thermosynechococcaceae cyanobacterium MS004]
MGTSVISEAPFNLCQDLCHISPEHDIGSLTLGEAYRLFVKDEQSAIPLQVWLLENPNSPIALPGNVDLRGHDCIHLLLNRGMSNFDEAFVVGFTMGNCDAVKERHISSFKLFSRFFYPATFRFKEWHLRVFELGLMYGRKLEYRNLHLENFDPYFDMKISVLRQKFGVITDEIKLIWKTERIFLKA